jgi:mono/diheme cytochrome c family protein
MPPALVKLRIGSPLSVILVLFFASATWSAFAQDGENPRSVEGLQLLYDFQSPEGDVIRERSGAGEALNLKIENSAAVRRSKGSMEILRPVKIYSDAPAKRLAAAFRESGEITMEAWLHPANLKQEGPARVLTLSKNSSERNFTLGQEANFWQARLRTTDTGSNGSKPAFDSPKGSVATRLSHVVYTRAKAGVARFYIDGKIVTEGEIGGELSRWDEGFRLAIGDEFGGQRAWLGTLHLIAVFDRALTSAEVGRHFRAGANASAAPNDEARIKAEKLTANRRLFERKIAPLLATNCIECHDTATREGKLDLSRPPSEKHIADGLIVAGKSAESGLWESVHSDEMPEDRDPLSDEDKKLLKEWIDGGAEWTLELIDPSLYAHATPEEQRATWVRRLTVDEYIETVRSTTGVDIAERARELLPAELRADGFSNTAYNLNVDLKHIDAYAQLAEEVVRQLDVTTFAARFEGSRSVADDKKMKLLVEKMGRWLLRGPIDSAELYAFRGIMTTVASAGGNFDESLAYMLEAMLQSPRFIYRIEDQKVGADSWTVSDHELAARVSYLVWGGPPDETLARFADAGDLNSSETLRGQVNRILDDPRAVAHSLRFASDWLNLKRLDNLKPDAEKFPNWNPALAGDMRAETLAFFRELVWDKKRPLSELLNAQFSYVTPELAAHYRLPNAVRPSAKGDRKIQRVTLEKVDGRGGLLTHGSVLTMGGDEASMVTRGLFVFHDLLRGVVSPPPPGLNTSPVPTKPGVSHRVAAEKRIADKNCGGCHARFEPLAFGLEKFDGLGSWFDVDAHGNQLREDGEVRVPGESGPREFQTVAELMDILAENERVGESLTWKMVQFALGRSLTAADAPLVTKIHRAAVARDGGTYQSVITELVLSDLIRKSFAHESDR